MYEDSPSNKNSLPGERIIKTSAKSLKYQVRTLKLVQAGNG
jgi:hypothetical protein